MVLRMNSETEMHLIDDDPALMRMPHPSRIERSGIIDVAPKIFTGFYSDLAKAFQDTSRTTESIFNEFIRYPIFAEFIFGGVGAPGTQNYGMADTILFPLRFNLAYGRIFQTRDSLDLALQQSDIGDKSPCQFLRLPFPNIFFEFGETRSSPYTMQNPISGSHILEGSYVSEMHIPGDCPTKSPKEKGLDINPHNPYRVLEIMLTGSPLHKEGYLDDSTLSIILFIQDEEEPLSELLDRHFDYYQNNPPEGLKGMNNKEAIEYRNGITHLAKTLLYINSEQGISESLNEYSELKARISRTGSKKKGKLLRKLPKTYDRVLIGKPYTKTESESHGEFVEYSKSTFWRRGFFRKQAYGEGRLKRKLLFIEPTLVGKDSLGNVKNKPYSVR